MTHKKLNYLLISLISLLLCVLIFSTVARAEDWSWMAQGGVKVNSARSKGYDLGYGVQAEAGLRWRFLEGRLYADYMSESKQDAEWGRHYTITPELRGYFYDSFYAVGAYKMAGYWSEFSNGTVWEKHGANWGFGGGYNSGDTEVQLVYFLREHASPNKVQATVLKVQQRVWQGLFITAGGSYETWEQDGERWSGPTFNMGAVWRFE